MSKLGFDGGLTVSMAVTDLDRGIEWYQRVLGFELIYRMDEIGWCEMHSPVDRVNVGLSAVEQPTPGGSTPTFGVNDIELAQAELAKHEVRTDGDIQTIEGMVKLLTFFDPDGNTLMLYQDLQTDG